jgi:hypothetical protein
VVIPAVFAKTTTLNRPDMGLNSSAPNVHCKAELSHNWHFESRLASVVTNFYKAHKGPKCMASMKAGPTSRSFLEGHKCGRKGLGTSPQRRARKRVSV